MPPRPAAFGVRQGVTYRPRDLPIISFANKLDHQGRDPFDLLDEIEQSLAVDVTLASFFASRRRQNHIGREIAAVWRDDSARGQSHSARRARRRARLRWMSIERGHGISVSEAIMSFEHGTRLQSARLPGSPGFQRGRLPRANRGRQPVMVLDATKAPGGQTQELSEVCRPARLDREDFRPVRSHTTLRISKLSYSHYIMRTISLGEGSGTPRGSGGWVDKQLQPKGEILM
jgi:hypothetical protein